MKQPIDRATFHRMAPELMNQWTGPGLIHHARLQWGEACAWGVAFALRLEWKRLDQLLEHYRKELPPPAGTAGGRLAQRLVFTVKETRAALRKAWRESETIKWQ